LFSSLDKKKSTIFWLSSTRGIDWHVFHPVLVPVNQTNRGLDILWFFQLLDKTWLFPFADKTWIGQNVVWTNRYFFHYWTKRELDKRQKRGAPVLFGVKRGIMYGLDRSFF
jgi:hypothetical protein